MATLTARHHTRTMQNAILVCCGFCSLLPGWGCGKYRGQQDNRQQDAAHDAKTYVPGGIHGHGWHIPWRVADPKHPNGPPLKVLIADADDGSMAHQDDNILLHLEHVHAKLFRAGNAAALVQADEVTTDRNSKVVVGTGHVIVTSLSDPPDTVITSDKMTWDRSTSKVVAIGNVHARQTRAGKPSSDTYSERMEYDMGTGRVKG